MSARLDIHIQRNETWATSWNATSAGGEAIDLTGCSLQMQVRDKVAQTLIASAKVEITDAAAGQFDVMLDATEGSDLAVYGNPIQVANLPYDLRLVDTDGVATVLVTGTVILSRGETVNNDTYVAYSDDGAFAAGDNFIIVDDGALG